MPTSTLDGYDFVHMGPLTTTWTAPASCSTALRNQGVAYTEVLHPPQYLEKCDFGDDWGNGPPHSDCYPSGEDLDDYLRRQTDAAGPFTFLNYFSPGLHCPASWTTAGIAVKDDSGSISATGVFSMTEFIVGIGPRTTEIEEFPSSEPWPNRMAHALDDGETVIACCPR